MNECNIHKLSRAHKSLPDIWFPLPQDKPVRLPNNPGNRGIAAIITQFANNFLKQPKVIRYNAYHAEEYRSPHDDSSLMPDVLLADLAFHPNFYFCEVARNGLPITERRKQALINHVLRDRKDTTTYQFVTVMMVKPEKPFHHVYERLAPDTLLWYATDPERLICVIEETKGQLGY